MRTSLKHLNEEKANCDEQIETLKNEIDTFKIGQQTLERSLENEKAMALQEMSRGKTGALQALQSDMEKKISDINTNHATELQKVTEKLKLDFDNKIKELEQVNKHK